MLFLALHIPDGFLAPGISLLGWVIAVIIIGLAIRHTSAELGERQVPLMGVLAAFIFAAQAINFPIPGGTSGHVLGAALAAILLGPWAGTVIMTAVIATQGLLFQDGGLLVMGCNILNMGALAVFSAYAGYLLVSRLTSRRIYAAFVAAWLSVGVAAAATALQLSLSGTFPLALSLPALTGVYALVGVGEGLITVAALALLESARPELLRPLETPGRASASLLLALMAGAVSLGLLAPLASAQPDGLEAVAESAGFSHLAQNPALQILPDYTVPFISHQSYSVAVAVIVGTVAVFGLILALGRFTGPARD